MKFWEERKELEIVNEDKTLGDKHVKHMLYEQNFITGIKSILKIALENKKRPENANILTFIGKRGSGKTTAMKDFCEILKGMHERENRDYWVSKAMKGTSAKDDLLEATYKFRVLEPIDASLVEDREELFELILAKLYKAYSDKLNKFDGRDGSAIRNRENIKMFEEVLKTYQALKNRENKEPTSFSTLIQNIGGSSEIADKVSVLIDRLLKLEEKESTYDYVVITVDDLDLNIKSAYRMLEQLQKYFAYHKIIILVTLDYEQMVMVCTKHFTNEYEFQSQAYDSGEENMEVHCRQLANDYMLKVFPLEHRMYMPDMKKITKKAMIMLEKEGSKEEKEACRIKEFLMYKVAESMRIYYDICGVKYHFCEPDTVRMLVEYNNFLNDLDNQFRVESKKLVGCSELSGKSKNTKATIINKNREILRCYDINHERFNWDIMKRLAQTTLNQYQIEYYKRLMERDLERRAMYFVQSEKFRSMIKMRDISDKQYTYGDLLQKIYDWGRDYYDDKSLISCILASFTSEMVREYIFYRYWGEDDDKRKRSLNRLKGFIGNGFSNRWVGDIFPEVFYLTQDKRVKSIKIGYIERIERTAFRIEFDMETLKGLYQYTEFTKNQQIIEKIIENWFIETKLVQILECIDMFLNHTGKDEGGFLFLSNNSLLDWTNDDVKNSKMCAVILSGNNYSFDMLGFIKKSLQFEVSKEKVHRDIINGALDMVREFIDISDEEIKILNKTIRKIVSKQSLLGKYEYDGEVAFPFYNLDMAYNVVKRVKKKKTLLSVAESQIFMAIYQVYMDIEAELRKQDELYEPVSNQIKYADIFVNNPYIRMIRNIFKTYVMEEKNVGKEEKEIQRQLSLTLYSIMANAIESDNIQPALPED